MHKFILALVPVTGMALDLTPHADIKVQEGIQIPVVRFQDSGGKVQWSPPLDWRMSYDGSVLTLSPKGRAHASMQLRVIPRASGDRDILANTDSLLTYCTRFLPADARKLSYRGSTEGSFTIGSIAAREYLIDMLAPDQPLRASISILNLSDRERFILVVTAPSETFEEIRNAAIRSMFSWQVE
jgi:hypothetical protein